MPVNREKRKEVIKIFVRRQFRSIPGRLEKKKKPFSFGELKFALLSQLAPSFIVLFCQLNLRCHIDNSWRNDVLVKY